MEFCKKGKKSKGISWHLEQDTKVFIPLNIVPISKKKCPLPWTTWYAYVGWRSTGEKHIQKIQYQIGRISRRISSLIETRPKRKRACNGKRKSKTITFRVNIISNIHSKLQNVRNSHTNLNEI